MTYYDKNALKLAHEYIRANVGKEDVTVDATMGKGRIRCFWRSFQKRCTRLTYRKGRSN